MARVTVYATPFCVYCVGAKRYLKKRGIAYDEVRINIMSPGSRDRIQAASGGGRTGGGGNSRCGGSSRGHEAGWVEITNPIVINVKITVGQKDTIKTERARRSSRTSCQGVKHVFINHISVTVIQCGAINIIP